MPACPEQAPRPPPDHSDQHASAPAGQRAIQVRKSRLRVAVALLLVFFATISTAGFMLRSPLSSAGYPRSTNFRNERFQNAEPAFHGGFAQGAASFWRFMTKKSPDSVPKRAIVVRAMDRASLETAPDNSLWRLGHSTVLMKLAGKFWLTDPVFSGRASPVPFAGPKRFQAAPITADALPAIEAVILSHDHYDHLDRATILALEPKVGRFVAPLGVGERLVAWGIPAAKVQQLDWWQETRIDQLQIVATPARHFSGRSLTDRDRTLWASWVLIAPELKVFFGGDSGYFDGFTKIGERFGPFDLTMIEAGAYDRDWPSIHMTPEESVQAHLDLHGRRLMPIHNGTFDLALHSWTEPFERVISHAKVTNAAVLTPRFGERVDIRTPAESTSWWR